MLEYAEDFLSNERMIDGRQDIYPLYRMGSDSWTGEPSYFLDPTASAKPNHQTDCSISESQELKATSSKEA